MEKSINILLRHIKTTSKNNIIMLRLKNGLLISRVKSTGEARGQDMSKNADTVQRALLL